MQTLLKIITVLYQMIVGYTLGLIMPFYFGSIKENMIGERNFLPLGVALGVFGVGWFAGVIMHKPIKKPIFQALATLIGAIVGFVIFQPSFGFAGLLLPLGGALAGFYGPLVTKAVPGK